jgi:thiamine pyrophosphate-dependent acetolactate synthase large subunit-like protein
MIMRRIGVANAMPKSLGAKAAFPNRQVISLSGDAALLVALRFVGQTFGV